MHEIARLGIAAHALYKDLEAPDGAQFSNESRAYQWLRRTVESLAKADSPEEFLEHTKLEMFHDQVFCFTPKGRLIALPRGATPIDFAYAVHTDLGDQAVGAKINGRMLPLRTQLANGDQVDIITSKAQTPSPTWERFVVTGKAKAAIRRFYHLSQPLEKILGEIKGGSIEVISDQAFSRHQNQRMMSTKPVPAPPSRNSRRPRHPPQRWSAMDTSWRSRLKMWCLATCWSCAKAK